jgi:malate synthase
LLIGNGTELTKYARKHNQPLREIFCWAHGDGGPSEEAIPEGGYGLYYVGNDKLDAANTTAVEVTLNKKDRLLRYDDKDADFASLNKVLAEIAELNEDDFEDSYSFDDYLKDHRVNINMQRLAESGFSNTFCANSNQLSLKQAIKWCRYWHNNCEYDIHNLCSIYKQSLLVLPIFSCNAKR